MSPTHYMQYTVEKRLTNYNKELVSGHPPPLGMVKDHTLTNYFIPSLTLNITTLEMCRALKKDN